MTAETTALYDCRDAFADALVELAEADARVVAVVNDSLGSTKVTKLAKVLPGQVVNVGIAEQNMVGIGAGLANGGKIPFVSGASPFLTGRALEQIKVDAAYTGANVKLVGVSSGVAYGELGRHIAAGDISERAIIIATYALCGFANFSSIGIQIGGLGALAPERRDDLAKVGVRAMLGGALASWTTATIAGMLL